MNALPDEVMRDLLTVYLAGEASAETRRLVESYAGENEAFARALSEAQSLELPQPAVRPPDREMESLRRTRALLQWRGLLMAAGWSCTLLPCSMAFHNWHLDFFMLRDAPWTAFALWFLAAQIWTWFFLLQRRLRRLGF